MREVHLIRPAVALLLFGILSTTVHATDSAPGIEGGATAKDNDDWTGDQLQIRANLPGLKKHPASKTGDTGTYVAPAYTRFDVSNEDRSTHTITLVPRDNIKTENKSGKITTTVTPSGTHRLYNTLNFSQPWGDMEIEVAGEPVKPFEAYEIDKREVEGMPYTKYGWSFGAMLIPFKYHSKSKTLSSSNSYQAYLQYKRSSNGLADGPFISGGIASADIATGAGTSSAKYGVSYGLGWIFEVKKGSGFQLAITIGQDRFGTGSGYQHEGETWYAFSIGYQLGEQ